MSKLIKNFGENVVFKPKHFYTPANEQEVLDILNRHKNGQIRVKASGHAWSNAIQSSDVLVDMGRIDSIEIFTDAKTSYAVIGAGAPLKKVIKTLAKKNLTVPTMGGIMLQTVAGLASTATHGSGNSSFSHFIDEIRLAAFDNQTGNAKIFTINADDELRAARTALGCMGVFLSIKLRLVPRYWVTEKIIRAENIQDVLKNETKWPLQATVLFPYSWRFSIFAKQISPKPSVGSRIWARLNKVIDYFAIEILPHFFVKRMIARANPKERIINYYKNVLPRFSAEITVQNPDYKAMVLHTEHHFTFQHIEMEVFIPEKNLVPATEAIRDLTDWFAGEISSLGSELLGKLEKAGLLNEILAKKNTYVHHYAFFFRKVYPDDTLISMTAGNSSYYAVGFFSYHSEEKRAGYYDYTKTMALVLTRLFDSRLHWGKYFPLENSEIERLYPQLEKFRALAREKDPNSVFQNDFTRRVFGF